MANTHCLVDRGRPPPCLVYGKSENIDCAWVQLRTEYSHSTAVASSRLFHKRRLCGVLQKIQTLR